MPAAAFWARSRHAAGEREQGCGTIEVHSIRYRLLSFKIAEVVVVLLAVQ